MNIGEKIISLKESAGFKNFSEFGKAVGLPGDWILDLSKKETVQSIDITRLIKIADYFNITLDDLLKDDNENYIVDIQSNLLDNDICKMINDIKNKLDNNNDDTTFNGYLMNEKCKKITIEGLEILKGLIRTNL